MQPHDFPLQTDLWGLIIKASVLLLKKKNYIILKPGIICVRILISGHVYKIYSSDIKLIFRIYFNQGWPNLVPIP